MSKSNLNQRITENSFLAQKLTEHLYLNIWSILKMKNELGQNTVTVFLEVSQHLLKLLFAIFKYRLFISVKFVLKAISMPSTIDIT